MKRAIVMIELPKGKREFEIEIPEPGIVHNFVMGVRMKKTLIAQAGGQAGQMAEEVPSIMVEVDPDAPLRKRKFVVLEMMQIVEAEKIRYLATTMSQANGGVFFHLFEEETNPVLALVAEK